jgi:ribosomal protein S18 acetylase RimI-like enzyme/catechol 2,3-dioxygenase-like lactoylglutathione lyase family enzyme
MDTFRTMITRPTRQATWNLVRGRETVASAHGHFRPDGRWFVSIDAWNDDEHDTFLAAVLSDLPFDLYTIVGDTDSDAVRPVWIGERHARLGLIAVARSYRRRGLARALLAAAFEHVRDRGFGEVTAEVDETNRASIALLEGVRGRHTGTTLELVRRAGPAPGRPSGKIAAVIGRLEKPVINCPDPRALAAFYAQVLGLRLNEASDDWVVIGREPGARELAFQRDPTWTPPPWPPDPAQPLQVHLDIRVDDIDAAEPAVLALGARRLPAQRESGFRVFADPDGHPFCLVFGRTGQ